MRTHVQSVVEGPALTSMPQIEKVSGNRARATLTMRQGFEAPNGQQISGHLACDFTLARADGRLREERRPQGPCVPVQ